jgi:putative lipoprotein
MDELQGEWRVDGIGDGERLAVVEVPADHAVTFVVDGNRVSGHSGVNRYTTTVEVDGSSLTFGPAASTRMAGPPERMETEQRFLAALATVASWVFDEGELRLVTDTGATAVVLRRP